MTSGAGREQQRNLRKNLRDRFRRQYANQVGVSNSPVEALGLVREDHAAHRELCRDRNFEWISLLLGCDRTNESESDFRVIRTRREDDGGTTPSLLLASLRIELQPDRIAAVGNEGSVTRFPYQRAFPY